MDNIGRTVLPAMLDWGAECCYSGESKVSFEGHRYREELLSEEATVSSFPESYVNGSGRQVIAKKHCGVSNPTIINLMSLGCYDGQHGRRYVWGRRDQTVMWFARLVK